MEILEIGKLIFYSWKIIKNIIIITEYSGLNWNHQQIWDCISFEKKSDTYEAFEKFIKIYKPTLIESDKGLEFVNNRLKKLFSDNSIKLHDTKIKTEIGIQ